MTLDKAIADMRVYAPTRFAGIVLFRPPTAGRLAVFEFVRARLDSVLPVAAAGRLLIVTEREVRVR